MLSAVIEISTHPNRWNRPCALSSVVPSSCLFAFPVFAQTFPVDDPVIRKIWTEAMDSSALPVLAHQLLDVVGPRLVGTPGMHQGATVGDRQLSGMGDRGEERTVWHLAWMGTRGLAYRPARTPRPFSGRNDARLLSTHSGERA